MIKINFKNVGQGDSIFLMWEDAGITKHGLIDCNLVDNGIQPITDHINANTISELEFIILTHPHTDHFSGFPLLFDFCIENEIIIKKFIHTGAFSPSFLSVIFDQEITEDELMEKSTSSVFGKENKKKLWNILQLLRYQHKIRPQGFIKKVHVVNNDYTLNLNDRLSLNFLAPHQYDNIEEYIKKTYKDKYFVESYENPNNPNANLLSTVIQLVDSQSNWHFLLCSDSTSYTFSKLLTDEDIKSAMEIKELVGLQIPHHGSGHNHHKSFWDTIVYNKNSHAFISVGKGYGHPDKEVVSYFENKNIQVHCTNAVGGYVEDTTNEKEIDNILSMIGILNEQPILNEAASNKRPPCGEKELEIKIIDGIVTPSVIIP